MEVDVVRAKRGDGAVDGSGEFVVVVVEGVPLVDGGRRGEEGAADGGGDGIEEVGGGGSVEVERAVLLLVFIYDDVELVNGVGGGGIGVVVVDEGGAREVVGGRVGEGEARVEEGDGEKEEDGGYHGA